MMKNSNPYYINVETDEVKKEREENGLWINV